MIGSRSELDGLLASAAALRDEVHGDNVSYSKKVFIPLTRLCRDVCHYCTYAKTPRHIAKAYMTPEEVLRTARAGQAAGCKEALFTLGDKPELRYRLAREFLDEMGYATTLEYVAAMAKLVISETSLFPHINAGVMSGAEIRMLKQFSISQGLMLESSSEQLCQRGGPHFGSPDKAPAMRLETIRLAGEHQVPFTSGILIGIGETRDERLESLHELQALHEKYGHIQEIIIQNFRAKPDTLMADAPEPDIDELLWTIATARMIFGPDMNIQAPPNLNDGNLGRVIQAGINDWGGVSPVTPDFVNPEAPWPHLDVLSNQTAAAGKLLVERLAVYPAYLEDETDWLSPELRTRVLQRVDSDGWVRADAWCPGHAVDVPIDAKRSNQRCVSKGPAALKEILARASDGCDLSERQITQLFRARGASFDAVCKAADDLRRKVNGETVSFVANRNINYTNICYFHCGFCAFSKGKLAENLRGKSYDLELEEIVRRTREAVEHGATEVCLQGGIHPFYTGETYLQICRAIRQEVPDVHIHAFSPLEIWQGAKTIGLSVESFLERLQRAGLGTLPGTAAEILDDEVRRIICPDKINTQQWLDVVGAAHRVGLKTTSTIMFGHVDRPEHWARHLLHLRELQKQTGGITEFVPLPFVHGEAPIYLQGLARKGPTYRESILMHAIARLALHPHISNIQTSWVKMGSAGAQACLKAGCNDLGGTLMNESISRAAGAVHGQALTPMEIEALVRQLGREPQQRTTLYEPLQLSQSKVLFDAAPLRPIVNSLVRRQRQLGQTKERSL